MSGIYCICLVLVALRCTYAASDETCMKWALRRILGNDVATLPDVISSNASSSHAQETGPPDRRFGAQGKRGPPGPQGLPGPTGPPGICECVPEEVTVLQKENEVLKEQINRIRKTSPETFCLLGLKARTVPDSSISSNNPGRNNHARLDDPESWWSRSALHPGEEWLMVDLGEDKLVTGVVTQGRANSNQWVTSYKVEHSGDGRTFTDVKNQDGSEKVFSGNTDRSTKVVRRFPEPVTTRFIRIYPMTYSGYMSMRFDVIDC